MLPTLYIYQPHIPGVTDPADTANGLSGIEGELHEFSLEIGNLHHQSLWPSDKTDYDLGRHHTLLAQSDYLVLLAPETTRHLPASAWDLQGVARSRTRHAGRPPKCIYYCDLLYSFGLDRDLPQPEDTTPAKASSFELWLERIRAELAAVAPGMRIESWYDQGYNRVRQDWWRAKLGATCPDAEIDYDALEAIHVYVLDLSVPPAGRRTYSADAGENLLRVPLECLRVAAHLYAPAFEGFYAGDIWFLDCRTDGWLTSPSDHREERRHLRLPVNSTAASVLELGNRMAKRARERAKALHFKSPATVVFCECIEDDGMTFRTLCTLPGLRVISL